MPEVLLHIFIVKIKYVRKTILILVMIIQSKTDAEILIIHLKKVLIRQKKSSLCITRKF